MPRRAIEDSAEWLKRALEDLEEPEPLEWLLALLYASKGRLPSRIHVQKALFIASRYIKRLGEAVEFKAYRMGPWSEEVNDALEAALANGWIRESVTGIELTGEGMLRARSAWEGLEGEERRILAEITEFVQRMSEDELLLYVYIVYGYRERSDVLNRLLRRRRILALSMLRKGLLSTELAAKIAGMPLPRFIEYLKRRGVKPYTAEASDVDEASKL